METLKVALSSLLILALAYAFAVLLLCL